MGNRDIIGFCNKDATVTSLRLVSIVCRAARVGARGEGRWRCICDSAGCTGLGWASRRTIWSTQWCGKAYIVTENEVRAVAMEHRVECVEILGGQIPSGGDN